MNIIEPTSPLRNAHQGGPLLLEGIKISRLQSMREYSFKMEDLQEIIQ